MASARGWACIRDRIAVCRSGEIVPVVVCSAVSGVSSLLERLLDHATAGADPSAQLAAVAAAHVELAASLGVELPEEVRAIQRELEELFQGIVMVGEASPRTRARILSAGELMSTRLGVAWLRTQGIDAAWVDARDLLRTEPSHGANAYLSAFVAPETLAAGASLPKAEAIVTQGFIGRGTDDETTLLGRGGSDTSAAYLGELLRAERVEIWTDVAGFYTANPRDVDHARPIPELSYDEAAALAGLGAKILHPRAIPPVRRAGIPLFVKSTYAPDEAGTVLAAAGEGGIRGVTSRDGLRHLVLYRPGSWQPVGFVADVAAVFKRHGLSIDLLATSPSTLSLTLDPSAAPMGAYDALLRDLEEVCEVKLCSEVASVSLVGSQVRGSFERLGGVPELLRGVPLEMIVQGAADHHLTFVLAEEHAAELVRHLHADLFGGGSTVGLPVTTGPSIVRVSA